MGFNDRYVVEAELSVGTDVWVQAKAPGESLRSWDYRLDALAFARHFAMTYGDRCRIRCGGKVHGYVNSDGEVS